MECPDARASPEWWSGPLPPKRPADEALDCDGNTQLDTEEPAKRLCTTQTYRFQELSFQNASSSLASGAAAGMSPNLWAGSAGFEQPMSTWPTSTEALNFTTWNNSVSMYAPDSGTAILGYPSDLASISTLWTQDPTQARWDDFSRTSFGQQLVADRETTVGNDFISTGAQGLFGLNNYNGAQLPWDSSLDPQACLDNSRGWMGDIPSYGQCDGMDIDLTYCHIDFNEDVGSTNVSDSSSASKQGVDDISEVDDDASRLQTTAATTPRSLSKSLKLVGENSVIESVCDTCFGLLIIEDVQLRNKFTEDASSKEVLMEPCGSSVLIRDLGSQAYAGLVGKESAEPLSKLIVNTAIKLSATIRSPTMLEVLIYGCRGEADAISEMLLDHDCFLQQPASFDDSMTYFNPQCLMHEDDVVVMHNSIDAERRIRAAHLRSGEKSKVAELLDSASGPTVFRSVQVSEMLQTSLKEYQLKALAMMVEKESGVLRDAEFPSVWVDETEANSPSPRFFNTITGARVYRIPRLCLGGLLADDMGLGKTLTTLALIAGSVARLKDRKSTTCQATLIVAPLSTLTGWQEQIERHFKKRSLSFMIYHGSDRPKDANLLGSFDIVLTTYDTIRTEHMQSDVVGQVEGVIQSIIWRRVVLDEAHVIQNRSSKRFQAVYALQTRHRWCLTGTPIQHRLEDLGSLVEFLRVDPFDSPTNFRRTFLELIDRQDCTGWDRLRTLVAAISLRRTKAAVQTEMELPPRQEVTCQVILNFEERKAYDLVKRHFAMAIDQGGGRMNAFQLVLRLRQICNHGVDLLPVDLRKWLREASEFGSQPLLQLDNCESCSKVLWDPQKVTLEDLPCAHIICHTCRLNLNEECPIDAPASACPLCPTVSPSGCGENNRNLCDGLEDYRPSSKVRELLRNLTSDKATTTGAEMTTEKSVVFSAWTGMLDLIGKALSVENIDFQRLDGTKTFRQRQGALRSFKDSKSCRVLLASLGSAAIGLDLSIATRVHLMEPGWNPMLEKQALDRVHRLGQIRPITQFRYIVQGADSIERYILQRQEWKMALIKASVGEDPISHQDIMNDLLQNMQLTLGIDKDGRC